MCIRVQDYNALAEGQSAKPWCTIRVKGVTCHLFKGDAIEDLARIIPNAVYGMFSFFENHIQLIINIVLNIVFLQI